MSDDSTIEQIKLTLQFELENRFKMNEESVTARQIASFLDPRYKDLNHENSNNRKKIRDYVLQKITSELREENTLETPDTSTSMSSALEYLFSVSKSSKNQPQIQFEDYVADPQIRFDLDPLDWWRNRGKKYPIIAEMAKKYLSIPATSTSSERCFSTAGNIVTPKRNCLLPDNVNLLVFLFQNKQFLTNSEDGKM